MKLLDALKDVTDADLVEINKQIVDTENLLLGLKRARGVVMSALGKAPKHGGARKKSTQVTSGDSGSAAETAPQTRIDQYRESVYRYLLANGPQSQASLCKQLSIPTGSITATLKHPWFTHTAKGVDLAK